MHFWLLKALIGAVEYDRSRFTFTASFPISIDTTISNDVLHHLGVCLSLFQESHLFTNTNL